MWLVQTPKLLMRNAIEKSRDGGVQQETNFGETGLVDAIPLTQCRHVVTYPSGF